MNRPYIALAALLLGACAGNAPSHGGDEDLGASADGGQLTDMSAIQCAVVTVSPAGGTAPLTLTARTSAVTSLSPSWTVSTPSGVVVPQDLDSSGLRVSLDAVEPGTYTFTVDFHSSTPCPGSASVIVSARGALSQIYRFRVTPPASTRLPQQDRVMSISGGTPLSANDLTLETGVPVPGVLRGPAGPVAGEVQLVPESGPEIHLAVGVTGAFTLPVRLDAMYRVVLIPGDPALAPALVGPLSGAGLLAAQFQVDAGTSLSGAVHDENAAAMPGASIALRAGPLPSGLGSAAADGSYALRVRPGTYTLSMSKAGWPDLQLGGVVVPSGGLAASIDLLLPRVAMTARVVRADGITPVNGARVTIRSQQFANAATVSFDAVAHGATGVVRAIRTSAADGTLGALPLPSGAYDVLVEPPAFPGGMSEGVTGLHVAVTAAGEILLKLAARPMLTGQVKLWSGAPVAGARVRLRPQSGGAWVESSTTSDGSFALLTPVGVPMELLVDPPAGLALSSIRRLFGSPGDALGAPPPANVAIVLPKGLPIGGTVRTPSADPIPGAAIDALCNACGDPTSVAHAESDATGHYQIALPDPGLGNADAGAM